jgi:tetraacyldisaccharide 4'-kinase
VACGHDRGAALALLRHSHPGLALVISDDGLQHGRLPRSVELAVFDGRGAGNGAVLPAGPLREPLEHLATMDALLWRDDEAAPRLPEGLVLPPRRFGFHLEAAGWRPVTAPGAEPIEARAFAARLRGQTVHALAGIARPARFFATVRACGIALDHVHALPDHVVVDATLLPAAPATVLMTAKDAVKFAGVADDRCWFLEMRVHLDPALPDWLEELLRGSPPD